MTSTIDTWIEELQAENGAKFKALIDRVRQINTDPIRPLEEIIAELGDDPDQPPEPRVFTLVLTALICSLTTALGIAVLIYLTSPSIANL